MVTHHARTIRWGGGGGNQNSEGGGGGGGGLRGRLNAPISARAKMKAIELQHCVHRQELCSIQFFFKFNLKDQHFQQLRP